jgi:hypothetical protein
MEVRLLSRAHMNNRKVAITIVVILGLVIIGLLAALIFLPAPDRASPTGPLPGWQTYTDDKYDFEIQYPSDWTVAVSDEIEPKINLYKKGGSPNLPFTHHSNVTQVSIFPKGIGTEGVDGEMATSTVKFAEPTSQSIDFLLKGGARWATYATFAKRPSSWPAFGFVWASVEVEDPSSECVLDGKTAPIERCDLGDRPAGAHIVLSGRMNSGDRTTEERVLSTFRFLDETPAVTVAPGSIIVKGELVCLPHKDTGGPQTQECAIGLKSDDGSYYGLMGLAQEDIVSGKWTIGVRAVVTGELTSVPDSKYAIAGSISIRKISPDPN